MEENNKELVQSYILTTAKYDYNVYEKRILYRIIELMQELTEGKKLNERYNVQNNLFGDVDIQMPTKSFLKDEKDNNHSIAKKALLALNQKQIKTEDNNVFRAFNLIERPVIDKKAGMVSFRLSPFIASVFMDFSKGYRKYELQTAMSFESVYAMRFYEIFSNQKKPITFTVEQIKGMFNITDKYKYTKDFMKAMGELIRRLAIDRLHVVGDIYDRGPAPHLIMDCLQEYHNVDIQWGNHDLLWIGAGIGNKACIANVIRICSRYKTISRYRYRFE